MTKPRNVLFITADQWRADCLSAVGHDCVRTPNLDRLAGDGVLFANHFAQAAPCGPARASLYTGMYMMSHRSVRNGTPLDARHTNVALETRKSGYDPVLFGYTDVSPDPRRFDSGDPVLTTYEGVLPGMTAVVPLTSGLTRWMTWLRTRGYEIPNDSNDIYKPVADWRGPGTPPTRYRSEDSDMAFLTDEVLGYLAGQADRPWFVHVSYLPPHPPLVAPEPYNATYDASGLQPPVRAPSIDEEGAQHPWLAHQLRHQFADADAEEQLLASEHGHAPPRATYYGLVSAVDEQVGRLIDYLKASGAYENTLIVFTSDHGDQLGSHWLFGKGGYFDEAYHIPLILRDPKAQADPSRGATVEHFTESVDIMPTILDWLDRELPRQCDGHSLLPWLEGGTVADWRTEVHWEYDFRGPETEASLGIHRDHCSLNVIRDHRFKYVHFAALPPLLFDLQADPHEFRNLAEEPGYGQQVRGYAQKLLSWRMKHDERTLTDIRITPQGAVSR